MRDVKINAANNQSVKITDYLIEIFAVVEIVNETRYVKSAIYYWLLIGLRIFSFLVILMILNLFPTRKVFCDYPCVQQ